MNLENVVTDEGKFGSLQDLTTGDVAAAIRNLEKRLGEHRQFFGLIVIMDVFDPDAEVWNLAANVIWSPPMGLPGLAEFCIEAIKQQVPRPEEGR